MTTSAEALDAATVRDRLAAYIAELLDCQDVGGDDYLLDLGGDSLLATILANRLEEDFGVRPELEDLFGLSIGELADHLAAAHARGETAPSSCAPA